LEPGTKWRQVLSARLSARLKKWHTRYHSKPCVVRTLYNRLRLYVGSQAYSSDGRFSLRFSLHSHHTRSRTFPRIRLGVVARGYTKMAVVGGVPALRVAILAMPAALQSQMPQKVVVVSQYGTEPGEHVDLRVTLALASEAPPPGRSMSSIVTCPWGAVSGHHLIWYSCINLLGSYHAELHPTLIFVQSLPPSCTVTMHWALH